MTAHRDPQMRAGEDGGQVPDEAERVRKAYGRLATQRAPAPAADRSASSAFTGCGPTRRGDTGETALDDPARLAMGCGDAVSLAELAPGEVVLDLGAGGGLDCFKAARQVGHAGRVIGVDMTPEMLDRARAARVRLGVENVEFRLGEIEHLPVADESVDVVISNCVINLSPNKSQVFREAFRVLRPGGRLAVADMMTDGPLPQALLEGTGEWTTALSGVLEEKEYLAAIEEAGFVEARVARVYPSAELLDPEGGQPRPGPSGEPRARAVVMMGETGEIVNTADLNPNDPGVATRSFSGRVQARKPAGVGRRAG